MTVLVNVPNTPEGRAFLKQLKKYLPPGTTARARGLHSNRKGLEAQGVKLNHCRDVPAKLAERYRVYIREATPMPQWIKCTGRGKWHFSVYNELKMKKEWTGPFTTREAAIAARVVMVGTRQLPTKGQKP